jgi:hypothetical protein
LTFFNWFDFFKVNTNIDVLIDKFYLVLSSTIDSYIPKKVYVNHKFPISFSYDLKSVTKQKKTAHFFYKISNSHSDYSVFSTTKCKIQNKIDFGKYLLKTQNSIKKNSKLFWFYIKNLKYSPDFPSWLELNGKIAENGQSIVNLFSIYFSSVYNKTIFSSTEYPFSIFESFDTKNSCVINCMDVFHELDILNSKSSTSPNGLSSLFLYNCRFIITLIIYQISTLSLKQGYFTLKWKTSYINSIFKKGNKSFIYNYRPISIIFIIFKFFSKIIIQS